jgi:hypothetical protein
LACVQETTTGIVHRPVSTTFDERLLTAGKAKQVALTACRHTLLTIMNTMVHDRKPWQHQEVPSAYKHPRAP